MRKRINKYLLEDVREVAMWYVTFVVGYEKKIGDRFAKIFSNYATNEKANFKLNHSILLSLINQITNDANSSRVRVCSLSHPFHSTFFHCCSIFYLPNIIIVILRAI